MIAEFITGLFAGVAGTYLYSRHQHNEKIERQREDQERVTFSVEARERYQNMDLFWWQKYDNKYKINKQKYPDKKKDLEQMLESARKNMMEQEKEEGEYPPPTLSPVAKRIYAAQHQQGEGWGSHPRKPTKEK